MKRSPIRRKRKPRKQPDELERMAAFRLAALIDEGACLVCGSRTALVAHHVVTRNHVEREGGDTWDVRNAMVLCSGPAGCHEAHHARTRPVALAALPGDAVMFACELLGAEAGMAWLERRYTTDEEAT